MNRRTFFSATSLSGAGMFIGAQLNTRAARAATAENSIRLPETHIPIAAEADVVVIGGGPAGFGAASGRMNFYPDDGAYVVTRMLEKANVGLLFRTLFVDALMEPAPAGEGRIEAVVVENASGRQAIKGKIFVDATGRADVAAGAGAPFTGAGDEKGLPVPFSLMYKASGVDYGKLFNYQKFRSGIVDGDCEG